MIHGFTAGYTKMRVNMIVNAFRQIGEEFCFPFAKWETVSPMAQLAIGSASLELRTGPLCTKPESGL